MGASRREEAATVTEREARPEEGERAASLNRSPPCGCPGMTRTRGY